MNNPISEYGPLPSIQNAIEELVFAFQSNGIPAPTKLVLPKGAQSLVDKHFAAKMREEDRMNPPVLKRMNVSSHSIEIVEE